jgi:hypothetical protein
MRKRIQHYSNRGYWTFGISVQTPYELDHGEKPYCHLNVSFFDHSWWIKIPEIFKPKTYWVDTSNDHWNKDRPKPCGFTESIRKQYGFTFTGNGLHTYYGIQPGSWSRNDPENSDHSKLFWYPWRLEIVRHDLLYPNGDVYHRNIYPRKDEKHIHWWEVLEDWPTKEDKDRVEAQVAEFVTLEHYNKTDGKLQKARIRLCGEEREWRPKWTRWLPIFKFKKRVVDCSSDTELGTRAGSWKGGMMGWSCEWYEDETMHEAFWRWYKKWDGN